MTWFKEILINCPKCNQEITYKKFSTEIIGLMAIDLPPEKKCRKCNEPLMDRDIVNIFISKVPNDLD